MVVHKPGKSAEVKQATERKLDLTLPTSSLGLSRLSLINLPDVTRALVARISKTTGCEVAFSISGVKADIPMINADPLFYAGSVIMN